MHGRIHDGKGGGQWQSKKQTLYCFVLRPLTLNKYHSSMAAQCLQILISTRVGTCLPIGNAYLSMPPHG